MKLEQAKEIIKCNSEGKLFGKFEPGKPLFNSLEEYEEALSRGFSLAFAQNTVAAFMNCPKCGAFVCGADGDPDKCTDPYGWVRDGKPWVRPNAKRGDAWTG